MVHLPFIAMFTLLEKCTGWQLSGSFRHKIHKHIPTTFQTPRLRIPHLIPLIWISEEQNTDPCLVSGLPPCPPTPIFLFFPKQTAKKNADFAKISGSFPRIWWLKPTPKCQEAVVSTSMRFSICSAVSSPPSMARNFWWFFWTTNPSEKYANVKLDIFPQISGWNNKKWKPQTSFWWKRKTFPPKKTWKMDDWWTYKAPNIYFLRN